MRVRVEELEMEGFAVRVVGMFEAVEAVPEQRPGVTTD